MSAMAFSASSTWVGRIGSSVMRCASRQRNGPEPDRRILSPWGIPAWPAYRCDQFLFVFHVQYRGMVGAVKHQPVGGGGAGFRERFVPMKIIPVCAVT